jgi:hypothetical protein
MGRAKVAGTLRVPSAEAEEGMADGTRSVLATFHAVNGYWQGTDTKPICPVRVARACGVRQPAAVGLESLCPTGIAPNY